MKRSIRTLAILAFLIARSGHALDIQYPIDRDTYVDSQSPTQNYDANGSVRVLINGNDGSIARGLFRLPPEVAHHPVAEVQRVVITFFLFSDQTAGRNITLHPLSRSFEENSATWLTYDGVTPWTTPGGDFDPAFAVTADKGADNYFRWDITDLLANESARSNLVTHGALLRIDETPVPESGTPRAPFTSSNSTNPEKPFALVTLNVRTAFPITEDTYLDSRTGDTNTNFGLDNSVRVLVSSDTSVTRGLFTIPPALADYAPEDLFEARARFYVWQDNTQTRDITLYPLTRPFVEGTGGIGPAASGATWNTYDGTNAWTTPGGDFDIAFPVVGVKEPVLDPDMNDRFFSWDLTDLLIDPAARSNLLANGAILIITGENTPPPTGSDRAPFTSSDNAGYAPEYQPHVVVALRRSNTRTTLSLTSANELRVDLLETMPHLTHRIQRSFDLTHTNGWTTTHTLNGADADPSWLDTDFRDSSNAFYRVVLDP
jgi:hypothetical protein